jgi:hypothetical protein
MQAMKWKNRERELRRLRKKHPVVRTTSLPDLCCDAPTRYPSLSATGISSITSRSRSKAELTCTSVIIGTPHKQGPMVMFKSELPWAGGKKS